MPIFDSGVASYIVGTAEVSVAFPVDLRGNPHVTCSMCKYFSRTSQRCRLNDSICEFPEKYIGSNCPLSFADERKDDPNELDPE